jgi:hypothetical protein
MSILRNYYGCGLVANNGDAPAQHRPGCGAKGKGKSEYFIVILSPAL